MITFHLDRKTDVTGVSDIGLVAEGCVLSNGQVVLHWLGDTQSITIHESLANVETVHCHGGATEIVFDRCGCAKR